MRSSKSRSRSKTNRPRTLGNIINRVFDSSGPEGKVRGTPQQIIEKYQMLARDAQLSNDRVAAENFSQHAEHYTRLLAEATREMAAEQESRGYQGGQNNGAPNGNNNGQNGQGNWTNTQNRPQDSRADMPRNDSGQGDQPYFAGQDLGRDAGLVDLPEASQPNSRRFDPRPPREPRSDQRPDQRRNERRDAPRPIASEGPKQPETPRSDDARRHPPSPQLRFEDAPALAEQPTQASEPTPSAPKLSAAPIFESPAAVVAQIAEAHLPEAALAPLPKPAKPRTPRARVPKLGSDAAPKSSVPASDS